MILTFPNAKFYACTDPETLTHETPQEAVEAYVDDLLSPGCDTAAALREWLKGRTLTVTAYDPDTVDPKWMEREAERLSKQLDEDWREEYGDPDGDHGPTFPDGAGALMSAVVRVLLARATPWSCHQVGKVELSPKQIEEMMREYRPDWFEDPTPGRKP